jgi:hypothetical protein
VEDRSLCSTYLLPLADVLLAAFLEEALIVWDAVFAVYKAKKKSY